MKHLVSAADLSRTEAIELLDLGLEMSKLQLREKKKLPALSGRLVANLFFEDSTRTRFSFEVAEKMLSADVVNFTAKGSSVSKGESLKDTVLTLEAMGVEAIVIRHWASGSAATVASSEWSSSRVVNAGDGTHEHPTQALLDALTMRNTLGDSTNGKDLTGAKVLIVGDILHSRVARSNLHLLSTLGAEVSVCGPSTLVPRDVPVNSGRIYWDFDEALAQKPDFVMMLRMQQERMTSSFIPNPVEYSKFYGLTQQRFSRMPKSTFVMHPGPMNRGLEIASEVADSERSLITNQVSNGVAIRMAVLYRLLAQEGK